MCMNNKSWDLGSHSQAFSVKMLWLSANKHLKLSHWEISLGHHHTQLGQRRSFQGKSLVSSVFACINADNSVKEISDMPKAKLYLIQLQIHHTVCKACPRSVWYSLKNKYIFPSSLCYSAFLYTLQKRCISWTEWVVYPSQRWQNTNEFWSGDWIICANVQLSQYSLLEHTYR